MKTKMIWCLSISAIIAMASCTKTDNNGPRTCSKHTTTTSTSSTTTSR